MNNKRLSNRPYRSAILAIAALICCLVVCLFMNSGLSDAAGKSGHIKDGVTNVYFRDAPGGNPVTDHGSNIMLNGGHKLTILNTSNSSWYKVSLVYNKTTYTGYVSASYVTIDKTDSSDKNNTTATTESSGKKSDKDFESYMNDQGFPESYKAQLRELHEAHPSWTFKAVQTGIDWDDLVDNERNKSGQIKNLVQGTSSYPRYNWRSTTIGYNIKTDTWASFDGNC